MISKLLFAVTVLSVCTAFLQSAYADTADDNWPTWRGPQANGIAVKGNPPITWSETENIKWKIKFPGMGSSTPVVWGDKLFFQTAVPVANAAPKGAYKFNVVCLDRHTGKILWERTAYEAVPHEGHHPSASYASYSPVTDGNLLWVSFGSWGLHCYDLDGNLKWSTDLFPMRIRNAFGEGSSPALAGDAIVVQMDHEGESKILAFNKNNGELIWEKAREERTAWGTPLAVQVGDMLEVITVATNRIRSYNAKNGDLIWEAGGLTINSIPMPVVGFGNVYCTSGFRGYSLQAIKLGRTGDLTGTDAIAWEVDRGTPYVSSPLLYEDKIYVTTSLQATLSSYKAETGEPVFTRQRIAGLKQIYASPVGAAGRIYIADREGTVAVIKLSDTYEVLATNKLDDGFDASPVIVGDTLYLKGNEYLYSIAE